MEELLKAIYSSAKLTAPVMEMARKLGYISADLSGENRQDIIKEAVIKLGCVDLVDGQVFMTHDFADWIEVASKRISQESQTFTSQNGDEFTGTLDELCAQDESPEILRESMMESLQEELREEELQRPVNKRLYVAPEVTQKRPRGTSKEAERNLKRLLKSKSTWSMPDGSEFEGTIEEYLLELPDSTEITWRDAMDTLTSKA